MQIEQTLHVRLEKVMGLHGLANTEANRIFKRPTFPQCCIAAFDHLLRSRIVIWQEPLCENRHGQIGLEVFARCFAIALRNVGN